MPGMDQAERLAEAARAAKAAEGRGDDATATREWRRYRLIEDASRDPEELLSEGIALSVAARTLIEPTS
jgi:negative regulator of sigma E activity